ncbi:hypothetical protein LOK74_18950 [Brevibacillus humidisoli]|uniref:glycoside hydrolase family 78 protein n=1 Tax=Brevibacillus humidisoli TaxID=2895522 RepID=UPI001E622ED3|nr:hypothetical protein [Brevibacillus humidisoli]UFJ40092.1 hypothetical protein LOK74_18950 [Brevibacillus humidisoli]
MHPSTLFDSTFLLDFSEPLFIYRDNEASAVKFMGTWTVNDPPDPPSNLSPAGTSGAPGSVATLTPTLSWSFSDQDPTDSQSAYQVVVKKAAEDSVVHDTGKVTSGSTSTTIPAGKLEPDTLYYWTVQVWDNDDAASPVSDAQYFKTMKAPTATPTNPTGTSTTPQAAGTAPRLEWSYSDPEGHAQQKYQSRVYKGADDSLVHDSGVVASADPFHDVPDGVLLAGETYYWQVQVIDSTGMVSAWTSPQYFITNHAPAALTTISPVDTLRTPVRPAFTAQIGDDVEDDGQHFVLQLADDNAFSINLQEFISSTDATGWEVAPPSGSFAPLTTAGVDSTYEGGQVRCTMQVDLTEGQTYYWRMAPIDATTGARGAWTETRSIRVGDKLQFKLKSPIVTSVAAQRLVFSAVYSLAADGTIPAGILVEVCNNGNDAAPTWEDATTTAFLTRQYHQFANATKTAADWAIDLRVTVTANDSWNEISFDGIGFSFD